MVRFASQRVWSFMVTNRVIESDSEGLAQKQSNPSPNPQGQDTLERNNLITPEGFEKLKLESKKLKDERKELLVEIQAAVRQGDRSENAEYIYGKKRLREIDRRFRFLGKRMESARIINPLEQDPHSVRFGATVTVVDEAKKTRTYTIVGEDEIDTQARRISWKSPVARGVLKAKVGDVVEIEAPGGTLCFTISKIEYKKMG